MPRAGTPEQAAHARAAAGRWWVVLLACACLPACRAASHATSPGRCDGGAYGTCRCLLACPVFGAAPAQCDEHKPKEAIGNAMMMAASSLHAECESIQCIVGCSRELHCLDHVVSHRCFNVKDGDPTCDVECEDTTTTTSTWTTTFSTTTTSLTTTPFTIIGLVVPRQPQILVGGSAGTLVLVSVFLAGAWKVLTGVPARSPEGHLLVPNEEPPGSPAAGEVSSRLPMHPEPEGAEEDLAEAGRAAEEREEAAEAAAAATADAAAVLAAGSEASVDGETAAARNGGSQPLLAPLDLEPL